MAGRRRLPELTTPGRSSDETPRSATGSDSARQRRRDRQKLTRNKTSDDRETVSPTPDEEVPLPPRSNPAGERQIAKRRKARRRLKSTSSQLQQEPSLLEGFEDEIIRETSKKSKSNLPDVVLITPQDDSMTSKSAPTPRIYIENRKKFSSMNKDAMPARPVTKPGQSPYSIGYNNNYSFHQQTAELLKRYTIQVAKQTHKGLQKVFLFIHGINAGYALWICVFAFIFTNSNATTFFDVYRSIALITQLLFYLFLALCMIDILDRVDPVKFNGDVLLQSITAQNSAVALIFYAVSMVVNLVMMQTDDYLRMTLYASNRSNDSLNITDVVNNQSNGWRNLAAVRAAFAVAAWIIVCIHVKKDRLTSMIKSTEDKAFYEELNIEQNTIPITGAVVSP